MAQKRMFSLNVVDTDNFLEMPISSRLLYYELGMRADDDGFVDNWKKILLFTGLKQDDMKVLISKKFIIPFESGVIVIRHWRLNNYLQNDRIKPTIHQKELQQLGLDGNNVYTLDTTCIHSIDKISIEENSIDNKESLIVKNNYKDNQQCEYVTKTNERCSRKSSYNINGHNYCNQHSRNILPNDFKATRFIKPTIDEIQEYCNERNNGINAEAFYDFYESKNWYVGKNKMKDWKACVRTWEQRQQKPVDKKVPEWFNKEIKERSLLTDDEIKWLKSIE